MPGHVIAAVGGVASAALASRSSKKATKAATDAAEQGQQILAEDKAQARDDIMRLFPQAQQAQTRGFTEARQMLGGLLPEQQRLFQDGNVAAQNTMLAGLPQIQNAIMGNPVDMSGLQAKTFTPGSVAVPERQAPDTGQDLTQEQIQKIIQSRIIQGLGGKMPQIGVYERSFM